VLLMHLPLCWMALKHDWKHCALLGLDDPALYVSALPRALSRTPQHAPVVNAALDELPPFCAFC